MCCLTFEIQCSCAKSVATSNTFKVCTHLYEPRFKSDRESVSDSGVLEIRTCLFVVGNSNSCFSESDVRINTVLFDACV